MTGKKNNDVKIVSAALLLFLVMILATLLNYSTYKSQPVMQSSSIARSPCYPCLSKLSPTIRPESYNVTGCHNCIGKYTPCPPGYYKCYWCAEYDKVKLAECALVCGFCIHACLECAGGNLAACGECIYCLSRECPWCLNEACKRVDWSCCEPP
ncbi:MAG: hypothetical protein DRN04_14270 [Thermoprotei archaeon]|nr:MAG: hypothetical protein DRN04_14270 [Thermoprotei archaeon]